MDVHAAGALRLTVPDRLATEVADYAAQCAALADWLDGLDDVRWTQPSVLPGWDVRRLVGHVALVTGGLGRALEARSTEPAPTAGEHRPAELIARLRTRMRELATAAAEVPDRAVLDSPRGPVSALDWATTRIVELVVHCDDLSRSLPDREPVPLLRPALATAVRTLAEILAAQAPGRSVEVRVPPFVAVQAVAGPRHTRGTPANVVEAQPVAWLRVATGRLGFADAVAAGTIRASGHRADLAAYLPVLS